MKKPLLQAEQLVSEKLSEAKEDLNQADRATRKPTPSTPQSPQILDPDLRRNPEPDPPSRTSIPT